MKATILAVVLTLFAIAPNTASAGGEFVRGDCNVDGQHNIADAVNLLGILFSGADPATCEDACDVNDDGALNIADAITLLGFLFSGQPDPAAPFQSCGVDPTPDMLLCVEYDLCVTVTPLSLATDIQPIFNANCVFCHTPGGQGHGATGLSLEAAASFSGLVGQAATQLGSMSRITSSDPANSYLWHKLNNTQASVGGVGDQMPRGAAPLSQGDLDLIEQWILEGANP